jgi:hypothetical protein
LRIFKIFGNINEIFIVFLEKVFGKSFWKKEFGHPDSTGISKFFRFFGGFFGGFF